MDASGSFQFAMFHFPPYNYEEDYFVIRKEWCTLFDKYHVDMVMSRWLNGNSNVKEHPLPKCIKHLIPEMIEHSIPDDNPH